MEGKASGVKMVVMAEVEKSISLDGVACIRIADASACLCYLRFAPENPEDGEKIQSGVQGYVNDDLRANGLR